MRLSISAALTLALLGVPAIAAAQAERIADLVKPGQHVLIVDEQGRRIDGRVDLASAEAVRVSTRAGSEDVALDRIVRIDRPDTLRNGALTGLTVGLSLGVISVAMQPRGTEAKWLFASLVSNGVACTLLGTGIDALFDNRRTLYERGRRLQTRVAPVVGSGVRGATVAVTW